MITEQTANHLVETAVEAIERDPVSFPEILDQIPAAIYVTAADGTITYCNPACAELVGRVPRLGSDQWCATWKLYTLDGEPLAHERCPMAVSLQEQRAIRGSEAIAERPDGSRFRFRPYPTPLFASDGQIVGAANLLVDVTRERKPEYLRAQAQRCRRLAAAMTDQAIAATLFQMAVKYDEQSDKSD